MARGRRWRLQAVTSLVFRIPLSAGNPQRCATRLSCGNTCRPGAPGVARVARTAETEDSLGSCCFRAVATVTEIRDLLVDDHPLTISSPCPSVLSAGGRERTSAHRAPIRLVPERRLACRARVPARATLPGRGAPRVQLLGHPRPGRPPPAQPDDTASDLLRHRAPAPHTPPVSLPELHGSPRASGRSEREPPAPSWSPRSRSRWAAPACQHARFGPLSSASWAR
jgi:hypothetical protein